MSGATARKVAITGGASQVEHATQMIKVRIIIERDGRPHAARTHIRTDTQRVAAAVHILRRHAYIQNFALSLHAQMAIADVDDDVSCAASSEKSELTLSSADSQFETRSAIVRDRKSVV